MSFYEIVILTKPEEAKIQAQTYINDISDMVKKIIKREYWGINKLAYQIRNHTKAHYFFIGCETDDQSIKKLHKYIKNSSKVIRYAIIKTKKISTDPSPIIDSVFVKQNNKLKVSTNKSIHVKASESDNNKDNLNADKKD